MTPEAELEAACSAAVMLPPASGPEARALLRISGSDATRWLNGMATNSVQSLAPGEGNYNFFLNAQGRIQGDGLIFREPEASAGPEFLLATTATQLGALQAMLDHFIIMDDVELTPANEGSESLLLAGPKAAEALRAAGLETPSAAVGLSRTSRPQGELLMLAYTLGSLPILELNAPSPALSRVRNALLATGVPEGSAAALEHLRLLEGVPRFGADIRDRDLPQETNQARALHFNKGCYLGQEIVERIRSRGQVHRLFTSFELTGDLPAELPAPLESNGKPAGELTSAARVPAAGGQRLLALGYARRDALDLHQPLTYAGGTAAPRSHPARSSS